MREEYNVRETFDGVLELIVSGSSKNEDDKKEMLMTCPPHCLWPLGAGR